MNQLEEKINSFNSSLKRFLKCSALALTVGLTLAVPSYVGVTVIDQYNLDNSYAVCFFAAGMIAAVGEVVFSLHQSGPRMNIYIPPRQNARKTHQNLNYPQRNF